MFKKFNFGATHINLEPSTIANILILALRDKQAADRADMDPRTEALESAAAWNKDFNKERRYALTKMYYKKGSTRRVVLLENLLIPSQEITLTLV